MIGWHDLKWVVVGFLLAFFTLDVVFRFWL